VGHTRFVNSMHRKIPVTCSSSGVPENLTDPSGKRPIEDVAWNEDLASPVYLSAHLEEGLGMVIRERSLRLLHLSSNDVSA